MSILNIRFKTSDVKLCQCSSFEIFFVATTSSSKCSIICYCGHWVDALFIIMYICSNLMTFSSYTFVLFLCVCCCICCAELFGVDIYSSCIVHVIIEQCVCYGVYLSNRFLFQWAADVQSKVSLANGDPIPILLLGNKVSIVHHLLWNNSCPECKYTNCKLCFLQLSCKPSALG